MLLKFTLKIVKFIKAIAVRNLRPSSSMQWLKIDFYSVKCKTVMWPSWWRHYRYYLSESIFRASFDLIPYLEGDISRIQGVYNINAQYIIKLKTFEKLKEGSIVPPLETPLRWVSYIETNKHEVLIKFAFNSKLKFSCRKNVSLVKLSLTWRDINKLNVWQGRIAFVLYRKHP